MRPNEIQNKNTYVKSKYTGRYTLSYIYIKMNE